MSAKRRAYAKWKEHWKPREHSWRMSTWRNTDVNVLIQMTVKVATNTMHGRVKLGLELNAFVAVVINSFCLIWMCEFEAELFVSDSAVVVKKNNVYMGS